MNAIVLVASLPHQVRGPLADQQEDVSRVQAEGGLHPQPLGAGQRRGRRQPGRRERSVGEHPAAALHGLHQHPLCQHHLRGLGFQPRRGVKRDRGRRAGGRQPGGAGGGWGAGAGPAGPATRVTPGSQRLQGLWTGTFDSIDCTSKTKLVNVNLVQVEWVEIVPRFSDSVTLLLSLKWKKNRSEYTVYKISKPHVWTPAHLRFWTG